MINRRVITLVDLVNDQPLWRNSIIVFWIFYIKAATTSGLAFCHMEKDLLQWKQASSSSAEMRLDLCSAFCPWNDTGERSQFQQSWQILGHSGDGLARSQEDGSGIVQNWHKMAAESWMASFCTIMVNVNLLMKGINMHLSLVHNWGWCWPQFLGTSF